jgi:hypothetical protein
MQVDLQGLLVQRRPEGFRVADAVVVDGFEAEGAEEVSPPENGPSEPRRLAHPSQLPAQPGKSHHAYQSIEDTMVQ